MAVAGSPLGSVTSPAMGSWLGYITRHESPSNEWALITIRQLLVVSKIKVPLLHHVGYLAKPVIFVVSPRA